MHIAQTLLKLIFTSLAFCLWDGSGLKANDYSILQWSCADGNILGTDPNNYSLKVTVPLPSGCPKAQHIMASSEHLLIACEYSGSYLEQLVAKARAQPWTIWVLDKKASQWVKVRGIPHSTPIKWIHAFSSANTIAFDVLFKLPQEEVSYVRRYWVHTDKELCTWHDLAQGQILDATVRQSLHANSYRYLFLLEKGQVRKIDLLRAREISAVVPDDSEQILLRFDSAMTEDEGRLVVLSPESSTELKISTLSL